MVEVLIAMVIFSVGILGLYAMQMTAIKGNSTANNIGMAMSVLNSHIERLMNEDYTASDLSSGNHAETSLPSGVQSCRWSVVEWTTSDGVDNDGDNATDEIDEQDIKKVNISISYLDHARVKSVTTSFFKINQ